MHQAAMAAANAKYAYEAARRTDAKKAQDELELQMTKEANDERANKEQERKQAAAARAQRQLAMAEFEKTQRQEIEKQNDENRTSLMTLVQKVRAHVRTREHRTQLRKRQ